MSEFDAGIRPLFRSIVIMTIIVLGSLALVALEAYSRHWTLTH